MYDEIEDITQDDSLPVRSRRRLWIGFAILFGLSLLIAAAIFAGRQPAHVTIDKEAVAAEQSAYRAALTDVSPALRRARLTDFLNMYPKSQRRLAVNAQMQVIAQAEARDWAALTHVIFDTEREAADKLEALARYEAVWDTSLLGGREAETARMRQGIVQDEVPTPDRDLPLDPGVVPQGVPGDTLLGEAKPRQRGYTPPQVPVFRPQEVERAEIVAPPRIRKNRRPKYPRRALERGAEAVIVLELFINAQGRVDTTELISVDADNYENDFIRAAERAAMRTRYHPQTINGVAVPANGIEKIYRFEMRD